MKSIKYLVASAGVLVAVGAAMVGFGGQAQAATAPRCVLEPLPWNQYHKSFTVNGDKITGKFTLKGDYNCQYDMTLATFEAPSKSAHPFSEQKLYSYVTNRFGRGTHTMTTTLPDCYFQADLLTGKPGEGVKGTRLNDFLNRANFTNLGQYNVGNDVAVVHDALIGGDKSCEKPKPQPCPYDPSMEKDDPNCKPEEETPEKPEEKPTPKAPEVLPSTGPAAIVTTFAGVTASAGAAHAIVRRIKRQ